VNLTNSFEVSLTAMLIAWFLLQVLMIGPWGRSPTHAKKILAQARRERDISERKYDS
jgi:hypothetical protein